MAPIKILPKTTMVPAGRKTTLLTKSKNNTNNDQNADLVKKGVKRKADGSPTALNNRAKRSALGNLTNAVINRGDKGIVVKKREIIGISGPVKKTLTNVSNPVLKIPKQEEYSFAGPRPSKVMTRAAARASTEQQPPAPQQQQQTQPITKKKDDNETAIKPKELIKVPLKPATRRISNEFEKTEESLYVSALDFSSAESGQRSPNSKGKPRRSIVIDVKESKVSTLITSATTNEIGDLATHTSPPADVIDFDKENWDDPFQVSHYAMDIFNYLKNRESKFVIDHYMERQVHLSTWMRMLLIDWMVEVQETFELNHETLYLAVKMVDLYLGKVIVIKENLQLLGAAALLIACKFDERIPPLIDDFLYICDNAYNKRQLIKMELDVFTAIDYDLGIPLSYRFLRRYARCAKVTMPVLTLARYILEFSLMDYSTISFSDSKMACAALFIALRMNKANGWDKTLEYYTGYTLKEFAHIVPILNAGLHQKPREAIKTIRSKYSHKIFFEVAKTRLLKTEQLFDQTSISYIVDTSKD